MLNGSYWFESTCNFEEHTLKFVLNKEENEIYAEIFLSQYRNFFQRIWIAIKYILNLRCRYGHFDCWTLKEEDVDKLQEMINKFKEK